MGRKNALYIRIACSIHWAKEITKKVYHNKMNSVLYLKMDTIFMGSKK